MILVRLIDYLRDRLKTVIKVCVALLALLVVIDAIPLFVDKHHAHTSLEKLPLFWAAFGFLGCVLIILASKAFGKAGIMKREDYYDE
jgi:drug/metabolite transporter (DMT)-like permease